MDTDEDIAVPTEPGDTTLTKEDKTLLKALFAQKNGSLLKELWEGKHARSGNASEDDLFFCWQVNYRNNNDLVQTDRIFRNSKRMRKKWDTRHYADGSTYGQHTLKVSLNKGCKAGKG